MEIKINVKALTVARVRKGWTKHKLAQQIDVDPSVIGRVERGENLHPTTVKLMADALGLNMDDLVLLEEPQSAGWRK